MTVGALDRHGRCCCLCRASLTVGARRDFSKQASTLLPSQHRCVALRITPLVSGVYKLPAQQRCDFACSVVAPECMVESVFRRLACSTPRMLIFAHGLHRNACCCGLTLFCVSCGAAWPLRREAVAATGDPRRSIGRRATCVRAHPSAAPIAQGALCVICAALMHVSLQRGFG